MVICMLISLLFLVILLIIILITLIILSPGKTNPFKDKHGKILKDSTSVIIKKTIGGIKQSLIIRGENTGNPVLLFLHGGPGTSEYSLFRYLNLDIEDIFTVCYWEQRGAGMSYNKNIHKETMNLEQMISDTIAVTDYLRYKFNKKKIYIMGHSWGTFLGSYAVNKRPDLYHSYIGIGQMGSIIDSEEEITDFIMTTASAKKDKKALKKMELFIKNGTDLSESLKYQLTKTKYTTKYKGGLLHSSSSFFILYKAFILCREYTLRDKLNTILGSKFSMENLFKCCFENDLNEKIPEQRIPVYIMNGIYDYQTTYNQAKKYFDNLKAPVKKFYTFENSAHSPLFEEQGKFKNILINEVLKENIEEILK